MRQRSSEASPFAPVDWGFQYPARKVKQRKKDVSAEDEVLFSALQAGIEKNKAEEKPRRVFHLRTVSPTRRLWRNVKSFFRQLFRMDDSLG